MYKKKIKYNFSNAITNIADINSSFSFGTLRVAYTGLNDNGSNISDDAFEISAHTMYNCPIVANYDVISNEIGGHDEGFIETDTGMKYVNFTQPVGVVPESATWRWEEIEDSGVIHKYFVIDGVILWKRQPCYSRLVENGITSQSMEINIIECIINGDALNISKFEYEAFCLLERDNPCFEQASLQVFSKDDFKKQWQEMLAEYSACLDTNREGGSTVQGIKQDFVEEVVIVDPEQTVDTVAPVAITDEHTIETAAVEDAQLDDSNNPEQVFTEPEQDIYEPEAAEFSLTATQVHQALQASICAAFDGDDCPFYVEDYDANEVYLYNYEDGFIYGCPYTLNGNEVVIDNESLKKKIITYVDASEDVVSNNTLADVINAIVESSTSAVSSNYDAQIISLNNELNVLNEQVKELSEFKASTIAANRTAQEKELFSKFDTQLKNSEEYKALKDEAPKYSIEELEVRCFALLGKQYCRFSKNNTMPTMRVPLDFSIEKADVEPYGGLLSKYNK